MQWAWGGTGLCHYCDKLLCYYHTTFGKMIEDKQIILAVVLQFIWVNTEEESLIWAVVPIMKCPILRPCVVESTGERRAMPGRVMAMSVGKRKRGSRKEGGRTATETIYRALRHWLQAQPTSGRVWSASARLHQREQASRKRRRKPERCVEPTFALEFSAQSKEKMFAKIKAWNCDKSGCQYLFLIDFIRCGE